jgi:hypothetical protein
MLWWDLVKANSYTICPHLENRKLFNGYRSQILLEDSSQAQQKAPGVRTTRRGLSPKRGNLKAMSTNDIRYLERVEQYWLSRTQPNRGRCRSVRVDRSQEGQDEEREGER